MRRGLTVGTLLLIALVVLTLLPGVPGLARLRFAWLDLCQQLGPRVPRSDRIVVVAVDDASLVRHGQWPWPRTLVAQLIGAILEGRAAAVAVDIVMPEPDRLSPPGLPALVPTIGPELAARLAQVPSNDDVLASTLRGRPVVLGLVGLEAGGSPAQRPSRIAPAMVTGGPPTGLRRFDGVLHSVEAVDAAGRGRGLLNADLDGGAVRRIALVADVAGVLTPTLGLDLLRVANGRPGIAVRVDRGSVLAVGAGPVAIPTQPDGSVWLRYARPEPGHAIPAADVLAGSVAPDAFTGRLVLVGVTALGLADRRPIPGSGDMAGVEIHAQVVESLFDGTLLVRPWWAPWAESGFVLVGGALVIVTVPIKRARAVVYVLAPLVIAAFAASFALYHWTFRLVDASAPSIALVVLFVTMLSATLAEAERQRRALRSQVEQQREAAARLEGELSAARRIQMGILPKPADVLAREHRVELAIVLEPAREVGGDLYDFFFLDRDRLFFLLGDVSGKGLPGSLFMAISKSLFKSAALRQGADVAAAMRQANAEISRDNPEALFVTMLAGVLDVATGELAYCNAGHTQPYVLARAGHRTPLTEGGGPPLCVVGEFPYVAATRRLQPGDSLCIITDGVTEACNPRGELFGRARLEAVLAKGAHGSAGKLAGAVRDAVAAFAAESVPADDLAILVVRWLGPDPVSGR